MKLRDLINPENKVKEYVHSYLKWLRCQNSRFTETLSDDEIYNYFIKELNHPEWFKRYIATNSLYKSAYIYEFLSEFKEDAAIFSYNIEIVPKKIGAYKNIKEEEDALVCF